MCTCGPSIWQMPPPSPLGTGWMPAKRTCLPYFLPAIAGVAANRATNAKTNANVMIVRSFMVPPRRNHYQAALPPENQGSVSLDVRRIPNATNDACPPIRSASSVISGRDLRVQLERADDLVELARQLAAQRDW